MFSLTKKKCISFFRCESMWTAILMLVVAMLFFVPVIFTYVFSHTSDMLQMVIM